MRFHKQMGDVYVDGESSCGNPNIIRLLVKTYVIQRIKLIQIFNIFRKHAPPNKVVLDSQKYVEIRGHNNKLLYCFCIKTKLCVRKLFCHIILLDFPYIFLRICLNIYSK